MGLNIFLLSYFLQKQGYLCSAIDYYLIFELLMKKPYFLLLLLIFTYSHSFGQLVTEKLILGQWDLVKIKVQYNDCYGFYIHELNPCDTLFFEVDSSVKKMRMDFTNENAIIDYYIKTYSPVNDTTSFGNKGGFKKINPTSYKYRLKFDNTDKTIFPKYLELYNNKKKRIDYYLIDFIENQNLILTRYVWDRNIYITSTYYFKKKEIKLDSTKLSEKDLYGSWNNYNGTDDKHYKGVDLDTFLLTKKGFDSTQSVYGCSFDFQIENQWSIKKHNVLGTKEIHNIGEIERKNLPILHGVYIKSTYYPENWILDYENQILYFYTISFNDNYESIETITVKLKLNYLGDGVLQCIRLPLE
jgi:hypothetical protein